MINKILSKYQIKPKKTKDYYIKNKIFDGKTLYDFLLDAKNSAPEKLVLPKNKIPLSYLLLEKKVEQFANQLWQNGLRTHATTMVQIELTTEFIIALFACFRIGAIPLLVLPKHRSRELSHLAQVASVNFIISETSFIEKIEHKNSLDEVISNSQDRIKLILINQEDDQTSKNIIPPYQKIREQIKPEYPGLLLVSGGTTGLPKVIARSHEDYRYNVHRSVICTQMNLNDTYMVVLPIAHNFPLACPGILGVISTTGSIIDCDNASPENAFLLIKKHHVTITALVPSIATLWAQSKEWEHIDLPSLRLIQVGGSRFGLKQAQLFDTVFKDKLQQVYGMAEGLICMTGLSYPRKFVWATQGRPISSFDELLIVNNEDQPVHQGEEGELWVKGPYTICGYYNNDHANLINFTPSGYYRTGDKVKILKSGDLMVTGRIKDMIIRSGENIDCNEIEEIANTHPDIRESALIGIADQVLGEKTCLVITPLSADHIPTYDEIRTFFIEQKIAHFKIPDQLIIQNPLPKTAVGKIDRKAIQQHLLSNQD